MSHRSMTTGRRMVAVPALAAAAFAVWATTASAVESRIPEQALTLEARLSRRLRPDVRAWIGREAGKVGKNPVTAEATAKGDFNAVSKTGGLSGMNVEEAAFLVLMQATRDAEKDRTAILEEIRAQQRRRAQRNRPTTPPPAEGDTTAQPVGGLPGQVGGDTTAQPVGGPPGQAGGDTTAQPVGKPPFRKNLPLLRTGAGEDELDEDLTRRLIQVQERQSKLIQAISNLMRKVAQTQESIINNQK